MDTNLDYYKPSTPTTSDADKVSSVLSIEESFRGRSDHTTSHLKIIQANLNHSKQASDLIKNYITTNKIDIALLQDPYTHKDDYKLPRLPNNWISFNSKHKKSIYHHNHP
jgi:hypothetical protein